LLFPRRTFVYFGRRTRDTGAAEILQALGE